MSRREVNRLREQAERGDASAQFNLGVLFATGAGVIKDPGPAHAR
jgi:TPR repeat protein